jgi:hypothetical protein
MEQDQKLIELLKLHNENRIDYNVRKWETLKFFQTIITAILTAIVAGIIAMYKLPEWNALIFRIPIALLTIISFLSALYARKNLKRESELLYLEELQIFKITKLLGLDITIEPKDRWLSDDEFLLLEKWRLSNFRTGKINPTNTKDWLKAKISIHSFLSLFNLLFIIELTISILLLTFIIWNPNLS